MNVYVPEFRLSTTAGLHVPLTPFVDVVDSVGTAPPSQIVRELPKLNEGVMFGFTVTVNVTGAVHAAPGVNVYVPETWLSTTAGLHVPETPLSDVPGNDGTLPPAQMVKDGVKLNTGTTFGFTVTVNVKGTEHTPAEGVNV